MLRKKIFSNGPTKAAQDKNLLYRHDEPNEPTMVRPLSYVLYESPFASVSTVCRGHPSLVSLVKTLHRRFGDFMAWNPV
jgi:hypothetical protein